MECLKIQVLVIICTALIRNNDLQSNDSAAYSPHQTLGMNVSKSHTGGVQHWLDSSAVAAGGRTP